MFLKTMMHIVNMICQINAQMGAQEGKTRVWSVSLWFVQIIRAEYKGIESTKMNIKIFVHAC